MKLGILGGTFDPIHYAHLFIAEDARVRYGLDRVLFVPNAISPFKNEVEVAPAEQRYEMIRLAIDGNPGFEASRIEIDRPGPSYTVETLRAFRSQNPTADLYFICGSDAVAEIDNWREPTEVLRLATVVAVCRPGFPPEAIRRRLSPASRECIHLIDPLAIDLSSTTVRDRIRAGLPVRYLTPTPVLDYIESHGLYHP